MFFALVMVASLAIAFLRGRSADAIVGRPFRLWQLAMVGVILHLVTNQAILSHALAWKVPGFTFSVGELSYVASFVFVLAFLLANRTQPGFLVLLLGLSLNLLAIVANGGHMPGAPEPLNAAGLLDGLRQRISAGWWTPYAVIDSSTQFSWLCDRILMPLPFRGPVVVSAGDLVIAVGCFLFCNDPFRRTTIFSARRRRYGLGG